MGERTSSDERFAATEERPELGVWLDGSILIERYMPDRGGPQWLLHIVKGGELRMLGVYRTRHDALVHADGIRG